MKNNNLFNNFKNNKKIVVSVLIIFFILSVFFCFLSYYHLPKVYNYIIHDKKSLFVNDFYEINNFKIEDNLYTSLSYDSNFNFHLNNVKTSLLYIEFNKPLIGHTRFNIYYDNSFNSDQNEISIIGEKDVKYLFIKLPDDYYNTIKINFDGIITLNDIYIGNEYSYVATDDIPIELYYDSVLYIIFIYIIFIILILLLANFDYINKIKNYIYFKLIWIVKYYKNIIKIILIVVLLLILFILIINVFKIHVIWQQLYFLITIFTSILLVLKLKNIPEKLFLLLSLNIGLLYTVTLPIGGITYDEQIHYYLSIESSSIRKTYITNADILLGISNDDNFNNIKLDEEGFYNNEYRLNKLNEKNIEGNQYNKTINNNYNSFYSRIGHVPAGFFIFFSRIFGLNWSLQYILGRLANIIIYSLIIYFSIKRITYGKHLIAVISLTPTIVFLASNYSYDQWVFSWIILGISYFLYELQNMDKKIETKNIIIIIGSFILALGPKAVYFPLMLILFFLKKIKFNTNLQYKNYIISIAIAIIFIILTFMLPFIVSKGGGEGDLRGGAEVSASAQTKFILKNPIEYTKILYNFILKYLSSINLPNFFTNYSYLGSIKSLDIYILLFIIIVAFTDENKRNIYINNNARIIILFSSLSSIILICTALYISFTPVGISSINGVQIRYLYPFICPILLFLRKENIIKSRSINKYSIVVFLLSTYFLLFGLWDVCISKYN